MFAGDRDAGESIIRALTKFGEDFPINAGEGEKRRQIMVKPKRLEGFEMILTAEPTADVPRNSRADFSLFHSAMMEQQARRSVGPSAFWFMRQMGIEQPMIMWKETLEGYLLGSESVMAVLEKRLARTLEIDEGAGMTVEEALRRAGELPPGAVEALMQQVAGGQGGQGGPAGGAGGGLTSEALGQQRAESPFITGAPALQDITV